jgi:Glycosyltransferase like family 2
MSEHGTNVGNGAQSAPLLSMLVPTEGRLLAIDALVASMQESWRAHAGTMQDRRTAAEVVELVFVDSTDPPLDPSTMAAWDASWMYVRRGTRNVRQKRNQGAAEARGKWLAFVDSDCLVTSGYFGAILAAIEGGQSLAFAGRVEFRGGENAVWRVVSASNLVSPEGQTAGEGEVTWCATANLIVERGLFATLGGFDESLPFRLGGDDVDLGLRLQRSGNALRVLPDALVVHPKAPWSQLRAILPRTWRWGRVEYHLALRHPDKLRAVPPFFTATIVSLGMACVAGTVLTGRLALLWMLPLWIFTSTVFSTLLSSRRTSVSFLRSYLAGWLDRLYHLGSVSEYLRAGSLRFLWEALILEEYLEGLFPAEPLQSWSNLLAALLVGLVGAAIVAR